jgi:hypothetical protein
MKNIILKSVVALVALLYINILSAQSVKISNPDKKDVVLTESALPAHTYSVCVGYCRVTGVGDASSVTAKLVIEGTFDSHCFNGGADSGPIPGQKFSVQGPTQTFSATNGNVIIQNLCASVTAGCKTQGGSGWTSEISSVSISNLYLLINNKQVSLNEFLGQIQ